MLSFFPRCSRKLTIGGRPAFPLIQVHQPLLFPNLELDTEYYQYHRSRNPLPLYGLQERCPPPVG